MAEWKPCSWETTCMWWLNPWRGMMDPTCLMAWVWWKIYTEVISGSKWLAVVVENLTAVPITITKGIKVTQVVVVNAVPPVKLTPNTLEKLDEIQGIQQTKMTAGQRKKLLFQQLDLSGLNKWSDGNQVAAWALLAEYHDIFFLEPGELGCTDLAKHEIRFIDDKPFKERFWRILPLIVDEVCAHMKEMLEASTIHPSQSPWFNAVVLVHKKDRGLHFCIDFCKLNTKTKKDSYLLPQMLEVIESLVGAGCFSCLDLKGFFLAYHHGWSFKTVHHFHCGKLGIFKCECMPFGLCSAPATFQRLVQNCPGELNLTYCITYLDK